MRGMELLLEQEAERVGSGGGQAEVAVKQIRLEPFMMGWINTRKVAEGNVLFGIEGFNNRRE